MERSTATTQTGSRWKGVALPAEHGGWGFALEPVLLGLIVAPSLAGVLIGLAMFALFLARQPFKIALVDWRRGKRYARTTLAERFALLYGVMALLGMLAALNTAGPALLVPLLVGVPFGLVQLSYDIRASGRHLMPELTGPLALSTGASSIAIAGGWTLAPAMGLWAILSLRAASSVLYVRARIRLEKIGAASIAPPLVVSVGSIIILIGLRLGQIVPWLSVLGAVILLGRAAYGLSKYRRQVAIKVIGFQELAFGLMTVGLAAIGYGAGI